MADILVDVAGGGKKLLKDIGGSRHAEVVVGAPTTTKTVTIASGQTVSTAVDVDGFFVVGVAIGATFAGTTLAVQHSVDGTNYLAEIDTSGNAVSYTVAAGKYLALQGDSKALWGHRSIKLVAGTAQSADQTLTLVLLG